MATSRPELVYFASQRPRLTLNKFGLRAAVFVHPEEPLSIKPGPCAKVHPLRPISPGNAGTSGRQRAKKLTIRTPLDEEEVHDFRGFNQRPRSESGFIHQNAQHLLAGHRALHQEHHDANANSSRRGYTLPKL